MTLRPFLQGRTPAPVRPNPGAVEPTSLVALLGTGDPIEWRTERAIWPGVAREMLRFRKALARLDPSLPPGDRVDGRVPWPFHADARGGLLTVEWWGDLAAPMILPVVHGDEAQELVDRYGTDPAGPRQRFAVYRGGLADWWTSARPAKMLDRLAARGVRPPRVHAANSAATLNLPEARFDWLRIGLLAYGQAGDPRSPHHVDGTEAYAAKALRNVQNPGHDLQDDGIHFHISRQIF